MSTEGPEHEWDFLHDVRTDSSPSPSGASASINEAHCIKHPVDPPDALADTTTRAEDIRLALPDTEAWTATGPYHFPTQVIWPKHGYALSAGDMERTSPLMTERRRRLTRALTSVMYNGVLADVNAQNTGILLAQLDFLKAHLESKNVETRLSWNKLDRFLTWIEPATKGTEYNALLQMMMGDSSSPETYD